MPYPADHADKDIPVATLDPVPSIVAALADESVLTRQAARERLTEIGPAAVPALADALKHGNAIARWEAAKALQDIADPSAAPALVVALDDDDAGVRWLAAEALIAIRREGVPDLLNGLIERSDSEWFREGAHHVLGNFIRYKWAHPLVRVVKALDGIVPQLEAPVAAQMALYEMEAA